MKEKESLDLKIRRVFPNESVYKSREIYSVFSGKNIPSFIKDWLVQKFTDEDGTIDKTGLLSFLEKFIPQKEDAKKLKGELISTKTEKKILARVLIEPDVKKNLIRFSIPDLGISLNEGIVEKFVIEKHKNLVGGEVWGVFSLLYVPPEASEFNLGYIAIVDYKPFKPYDIDFEYFREGRKEFTLEEWIDLLIKSMEYNPAGFDSLEQKLSFLSRLLIFVEPRLNMIELSPKSTGKSYIFNNLSKYGWCISGGNVSRAKMFYDMARNTFGYITRYDFVALDEIQTIKFSNEEELSGALKSYLESGTFKIGNILGTSEAGLMLLGNIPLTEDFRPINQFYFSELPEFFKESALLDRFHGFNEGWKLPRINESMKVTGYALNVEYFSEVLHSLRNHSEYSLFVNELVEVEPKADTRDTNAIKRLATAYLKLLFPHVNDVSEINKEEFEIYCLNPAIEKRGIIRKQIHLIDPEYKDKLPEIKIKKF
ncbi:MAG: TIGR02688 family protein [Dictyoglomus sp. NZ13-RE01]|nr:MAG: TIGR02688 family protein [Dictyoglomus sp. NZ13-RE01]